MCCVYGLFRVLVANRYLQSLSSVVRLVENESCLFPTNLFVLQWSSRSQTLANISFLKLEFFADETKVQ